MKRRLTDYFVSLPPKRPSVDTDVSTTNQLDEKTQLLDGCTEESVILESKTSTDEKYDIGQAVDKKLSENEKLKYLTETWQPSPNFDFPVKLEGKQTRKFNGDWLEKHRWLAYSKQMSGGFCKVCVLFASSGAGVGSQPLKTLVREPLSKFKKATELLKHHESTEYHKFSMEKAINFKKIMTSTPESSQSISLMLDKKKAEIIKQNRKRLSPIIKTIVFCAQNNLPLRGHRDDGKLDNEKEQEDASRGKQGVFKSLLTFRIDAGDEDLKGHLATCKKNSTLISKTIQNEIIECIGEVLRAEIVENIKKNKFFSIMCDETTDFSTKEQLTFCVRYIDMDTFLTKEQFLGFIELKSTTSLANKTAIDKEMAQLGLSYEYLCGQGYDGGSNMAGRLNGVQALVAAQQPLAIYTHCFSHSLNLCITKTCDIPVIRNVMGTVGAVSKFFSASAQRTNALADAIASMNLVETRKRKLKILCPTRWVERHDSLLTFKELLVPIITVLENLNTHGSSEASAKAYLMISAIKKSEFIVGLVASAYCLSFTLKLSENLQTPKQDLSSAMAHVSDVLKVFKNIRENAELEFRSIFEDSMKLADELGCELNMPRTCKRQTGRDNVPAAAGNPEEYFRRSIFMPLMDHFISELASRFNRDFNGILALEGLIPANLCRYSDEAILVSAEKYRSFIESLSSCDVLKAELKLWRTKWADECSPPTNVTESIKQSNKTFFPNIAVLLQVFGTIPVTTATAERSFSVLKRLKTFLRNTMGQTRLNGLALANICKDHEINIDKVMDLFAKTKHRRMCVNNWEDIVN